MTTPISRFIIAVAAVVVGGAPMEAAAQQIASPIQARARSQAARRSRHPYVLLMHLRAFDARMLPRLLDQYRRDGAMFVTLEQAQADPFICRRTPGLGDPRRP